MRKSFVKLLAGGLVLGGLSVPALAQSTANTNATATTKIITPISIVKVTDLAFGSVVKPATAGTNTILIDATTGARTMTGTGTASIVTASASGRATFTVTGEGAQTFTISTPPTVSMTSGANSIVVTLTTSASPATLSGAIGSTGTSTIGVGGSFPLPNTQASGSYTATFATTVTYN